jgi:hypothetical protein
MTGVVLLRLKLAIAPALGLFGYSLYKLFCGQYFLTIALFLTMCLLLWWALLGCNAIFENNTTKILGGAITVFSLLHVFATSPALDPKNEQNNIDLFVKSLETNSCSENQQLNERKRDAFNNLKDLMLKKCAVQGTKDLLNLTTDLNKALRLGPVTGTADTIYGDLAKKKNVTCQDIAKQLDSLCPGWIKQ